MTLPRTVADVLSEHVSFEVECIDRMYLKLIRPEHRHTVTERASARAPL